MYFDKICYNRNWNKSSCNNKCENYDICYIENKKSKVKTHDLLVANCKKDKPDQVDI